ncbi:glycine betaine ABC transporter substrate-binding protein [Salinibacterium sp. NK8237]|uniref:glycine betaine ABC transporter substrate-binding protein n=1 Tax=Salinibacterium sp. NK8237 TaxID=2792038 RepID=UPI001E5F0A09|nr:glycine betaine ABC transporter substrate-binding protein [Salinibacterium sp. NK8237]
MKKQTRAAIAIGAAALLGLSACAAGGDDTASDDAVESKDLSIAVFNGWPEGEAVSYLWKAILEDKGYNVELEYADVTPIFSGLSTGDYDIALDGWLPITHASLMEEYGDTIEDLGAWNSEAGLTVAVNSDAPIDSLEELAANADEFGNRIVGIEPGAGLTEAVLNNTMPTYGLDDMELLTSSTPAMLAELQAALDNGENIAVTLWRPHWAYDAFDIKDLADPEGTLGDVEEIHSFARDTLSDDMPEVTEWISSFKMDSELLYSLENVMYNEYEGTDFEPIVADWIAANQDYVDGLTS